MTFSREHVELSVSHAVEKNADQRDVPVSVWQNHVPRAIVHGPVNSKPAPAAFVIRTGAWSRLCLYGDLCLYGKIRAACMHTKPVQNEPTLALAPLNEPIPHRLRPPKLRHGDVSLLKVSSVPFCCLWMCAVWCASPSLRNC